MAGSSRENRAVRGLPRIAGGLFLLAGLAQAYLQVFGRDAALARGSQSDRFLVTRVDPPVRGPILASDGRALALNEEATEFGVFFDKVPDSPGFFMALGSASGVPAASLIRLKRSGIEKAFWREPLGRERASAVRAVKLGWRADGISVGASGRRIYPLGESAAGFLGYMRDGEPVAGLELSKDEALRGTAGQTIGLVDRLGTFLPMRIDPRSTLRSDGERIALTIDTEIQIAATSALRSAVESNRADRGAAVALDPATGDILAMANWPSLDPSRIGEPKAKDEERSDFNANYMAAFEPGSTFKVLTLALAMDKGLVLPKDTVPCSGALQVWAGTSVRCDAHGGRRTHGTIDPLMAIAKSCNVSAATWALEVGYERYVEFLDSSGLMSRTTLGLPLEASGSFNRREYAKRLQLATFGFGQSMTCTPIGLASAFSMLANGGVRMEPRLVRSVGDESMPVKEAGRLVRAETASKLMEYMEAVVESDFGTGKTLRIPGYRLAGKTGTAQKINPKTGTVAGGGYVSNFVGFVPAEKPRALVLVMIDNPKGPRYYGASVAGPAFSEIARALIARYKIEPTRPELAAPRTPAPGVGSAAGPPNLQTSNAPARAWSPPSITVESRRTDRKVKP